MLRRAFIATVGATLFSRATAHIGGHGVPGVALGGFDPVAYHDGIVAAGQASLQTTVGDQVYRFANRANRTRFLMAPERYRPAYQGFCAYGIRMGQKLKVDPLAFEIIDGRLFLFLDEGTRNVWRADQADNISIADGIWHRLRDE
ncbi:MAG: YHS domain-containing (seleno)protein [Pseudomonadota bacterium]